MEDHSSFIIKFNFLIFCWFFNWFLPKLNISLLLITESYFPVPKDVRLISIHFLIMEIHDKSVLKSIAINHSADIDYKHFVKDYTK